MARSVLVTGATSGIGLATSLRLARNGFRTFGSARSPAKADELAKRAAHAGVEIEPVVLDLEDPAAGTDVVAGLDLWALVNNVGVMNVGLLEDVPVETARRQLEAMVVAPVRLAQLALPGMRAAGEGRFVTISSIAARTTGPTLGWYQACKHALGALTDVLRAEVAGAGIDVVAVEPGGHRTPIWAKAAADLRERGTGSAHAQTYDRALRILERLEPHMPAPDPVAAVVLEALTATRPKRRYRVGTDAFVLDALHAVVPASIQDRFTRALLRL